MAAEAAFDINEDRGKEGGQARVGGSQYRTKERVTRIGSAECTSHKELFLATAGETRTAKLNIALHRLSPLFQSDVCPQSNKVPLETCGA